MEQFIIKFFTYHIVETLMVWEFIAYVILPVILFVVCIGFMALHQGKIDTKNIKENKNIIKNKLSKFIKNEKQAEDILEFLNSFLFIDYRIIKRK